MLNGNAGETNAERMEQCRNHHARFPLCYREVGGGGDGSGLTHRGTGTAGPRDEELAGAQLGKHQLADSSFVSSIRLSSFPPPSALPCRPRDTMSESIAISKASCWASLIGEGIRRRCGPR